MSLHPALEPVSALLGVWSGPGRGEYPTLDSFEYTEEVTFTDIGKPFLVYSQRTWAPDGRPLHVETGYFRVPGDGTVEFVLAQPTGQTELAEGTLSLEASGFSVELRSRVVNAPTAKTVDATARTLRLEGDRLTTTFAMAAVGVPMTDHLASVLTRQVG
ncbi:FABP family protein [Microbacterium sp. A93]|uniref:FABP family protein n=1 Tax=Microbacterium sp. A93 TaxID=3450716 RepID=UPI003F4403DF